MKSHFLIAIPICVTAAFVGCGESRSPSDHTQRTGAGKDGNARIILGLDPTDQRIIDFIGWLKRNGVTLEYTKREGFGDWKVVVPRSTDDYDVIFSIGSFPASASEQQMREALDINLAYLLNAPAHLAMSHAGTCANRPDAKLPRSDDEFPKLNGLPITKATEQLFEKYKGG